MPMCNDPIGLIQKGHLNFRRTAISAAGTGSSAPGSQSTYQETTQNQHSSPVANTEKVNFKAKDQIGLSNEGNIISRNNPELQLSESSLSGQQEDCYKKQCYLREAGLQLPFQEKHSVCDNHFKDQAQGHESQPCKVTRKVSAIQLEETTGNKLSPRLLDLAQEKGERKKSGKLFLEQISERNKCETKMEVQEKEEELLRIRAASVSQGGRKSRKKSRNRDKSADRNTLYSRSTSLNRQNKVTGILPKSWKGSFR